MLVGMVVQTVQQSDKVEAVMNQIHSLTIRLMHSITITRRTQLQLAVILEEQQCLPTLIQVSSVHNTSSFTSFLLDLLLCKFIAVNSDCT